MLIKKREETKPPCSSQIEKQSIVGFIVFNALEDNNNSFVSYFVAQWTHILATLAHQHLKVWLINVKGINQLSPIIPKHADLYNNIYIMIQSSTRPFIQGMKIKPMPKPHRLEIRMQFAASLIWMQSKHPRSSNTERYALPTLL